MMDLLDRVAEPAEDLLVKVDGVLIHAGTPDDHPLVPLLRRLRALPGEAVAAVAMLRPVPLAAAVPELRNLSNLYAQTQVVAPDWHGPAADEFTGHWASLSAHIEHDLAGRLAGTALFAEALADWAGRTRSAVAHTLATVLASAEAVTVVCGAEPDQVTGAAADIAARVLGTVADAYAEAETLLVDWSGQLGEFGSLSSAPGCTSPSVPGCTSPSAPGGTGTSGRLDARI